MATAPYRFIDRRGQNYGGSNKLYQAATAHPERETPSDLAHDTSKNLTELGRRTLLNINRKLFADFPALEATILEKANLAVGTFLPQHKGRTKSWTKLAESWLVDEWLPICDLRGWPYDGATYLELHVISEIRDGDMGTLLTETSQGYPAIQIIPGHRIRSPIVGTKLVKVRLYQDKLFINGIEIDKGRPFIYEDPIEWEAPICDGAILGPFGNPLAHRVGDDGYGYDVYQDIPARGLFLNFHPKWSDQSRGIPGVGSGAFYWQDMKESRRFDLAAQKVASALYAWETNEAGEHNATQKRVQSATFGDADENNIQPVESPAVIDIKGGIRFGRSGSGAKIEFPNANRPGPNTQQFQETVLRDALAGIEWSYIFGVDPSKAGGAALRIVVERINRVLEKARKSPAKSFKRIVGYAIAKAMDKGILPWDDDWWMWEFQGQKRLTADAKYDSDVSHQEIKMGISTRKREIGARGGDPEDVKEQKFTEADELLSDAKRLSDKYQIPINLTIPLLSDFSSYSTMTNASAVKEEPAEPAPAAEPKEAPEEE